MSPIGRSLLFLKVTCHIAIDPKPPLSQLDLTTVKWVQARGVGDGSGDDALNAGAGESVSPAPSAGCLAVFPRSRPIAPLSPQHPKKTPTTTISNVAARSRFGRGWTGGGAPEYWVPHFWQNSALRLFCVPQAEQNLRGSCIEGVLSMAIVDSKSRD